MLQIFVEQSKSSLIDCCISIFNSFHKFLVQATVIGQSILLYFDFQVTVLRDKFLNKTK